MTTEDTTSWLGHKQIAAVEGALKAGAYVQRAYLHAKEHASALPPWARKLENGRWQFDAAYIRRDAADNLRTLSVSDAAALLGTTRRTVQNWIDDGKIRILGGRHRKGKDRRILKQPFLADLEILKTRLETPAVIGQKLQRGQPVAREVLDRVDVGREPEAKLASAKALSAAALEARLTAARRALRERKRTTPAESGARKADSAALVEARLHAAKEFQANRMAIQRYASEVAERLMSDVFDGHLDRIDGVVLYNRITEERGVPSDIRIAVRKTHFGR